MQDAVQHFMSGPRMMRINLNGPPFECQASEKYFWFREDYERRMRRKLDYAPSPEAVFYDVGANARFWPVLLHATCCHFYAVEPSSVNFVNLQRNVRGLANVTPVHAACSDASGTLHFSERGSISTIAENGPKVPQNPFDVMKLRLKGMVPNASAYPA